MDITIISGDQQKQTHLQKNLVWASRGQSFAEQLLTPHWGLWNTWGPLILLPYKRDFVWRRDERKNIQSKGFGGIMCDETLPLWSNSSPHVQLPLKWGSVGQVPPSERWQPFCAHLSTGSFTSSIIRHRKETLVGPSWEEGIPLSLTYYEKGGRSWDSLVCQSKKPWLCIRRGGSAWSLGVPSLKAETTGLPEPHPTCLLQRAHGHFSFWTWRIQSFISTFVNTAGAAQQEWYLVVFMDIAGAPETRVGCGYLGCLLPGISHCEMPYCPFLPS